MKVLLYSFLIIVFIGCSNKYEGLGDYRYAKVSKGKDTEVKFDYKYIDNTNEIKSQLFYEEDYISINLKNAFFKFIPESDFEVKYQKSLKKNVKGEILIIANISSGVINPISKHSNPELPGKVIYYSGDIEEGQSANQSFGPVYGPIKWDGNGLTIDITVIELDNEENNRFGSLLSTLSKAGKTYYSDSISTINLLNSLGQSIVSANENDIMASYTLRLVPRINSIDKTYLPVLRTGDIVLIRKDKRDESIDWKNLKYNPKDGKIYKDKVEFKKENYLVFTISKRTGGIDLTPSINFSEFLIDLDEKSINKKFEENMEKVRDNLKMQSLFISIKKELSILNNSNSFLVKKRSFSKIIKTMQCSSMAIELQEINNKLEKYKRKNLEIDLNNIDEVKSRSSLIWNKIKESEKKINTIKEKLDKLNIDNIASLEIEKKYKRNMKEEKKELLELNNEFYLLANYLDEFNTKESLYKYCNYDDKTYLSNTQVNYILRNLESICPNLDKNKIDSRFINKDEEHYLKSKINVLKDSLKSIQKSCLGLKI